MKEIPDVKIKLDDIQEGLVLWIDPRKNNSLFDAGEQAPLEAEARYQIREGCFYDFSLSDNNYTLGDVGEGIIQPHKRNNNFGIIAPNIFVGRLVIPVINCDTTKECGKVELEVQSAKTSYREDYRVMLEYITERCTELLLNENSPVSQYFEPEYTKDSRALYQRFAFIKSIIGTDEFTESIHRIITSPVTFWKEIDENSDIRKIKRFSNSGVKEILRSTRRNNLPESHHLNSIGINTLPERIDYVRKADSIDTPENRFIKHALEAFASCCFDINNAAKEGSRLKIESDLLIQELESHLHHSFFRDISRPHTLKLNSPVLQRKEGYREVLRVWLMFDLAAKLIWKGGDDIYDANKKDIATLYEYWLFFKLLDLLQSIFDIQPKEIHELIKETSGGLSLQLKQGTYTALNGVYQSTSRKLNVCFNYNRSFSGGNSYTDQKAGSWTTTLRPDYTLSIWPYGIDEPEAEKQDLIVHIHFDAKYKVANLLEQVNKRSDIELDEEKTDNRKGVYKNADLLKMHAYKDAIRRSGGAYVLYPGEKEMTRKGFHEIIPGLGAFPVRPSKTDDGTPELKSFILKVVDHFLNRASQREKVAFRNYDVYKNPPPSDSELKELLPEPYGNKRDFIPDDIFVLIGYCKSEKHYKWILENNLYNFRMNSDRGSLILDKEKANAKYLLLHKKGEEYSGDLWCIKGPGPKVYSKEGLIAKGYPSPGHDTYLVYEVEKAHDSEFENAKWDFRKLSNYKTYHELGFPFTASLTELMRTKIK